MKRLLIISVSAGAGHKRAAEALQKQATIDYPELEVKHIDFTDYISLPTKAAFFDSYEMLVRNAPMLWGMVYKQTDTEFNRKLFDAATSIFHTFDTGKFVKEVKKINPDHIICTHFTPSDALSRSFDDAISSIPQSIVVTDFYPHELWITSPKHTYFVSTKEMKTRLIEKGVPPANITLSGIPIDPTFYEEIDLDQVASSLNIDRSKPVILVLSGGQGLTPIDTVVSQLFDHAPACTIIAVAGKNKHLETRLRKLKAPSHIFYTALGWTDALRSYLHLCDLVVTKAGGITTSECIALGKPMLISSVIPGQEAANVDYIVTHGHGAILNTNGDITKQILDTMQLSPIKEKRIAAKTILSTILG